MNDAQDQNAAQDAVQVQPEEIKLANAVQGKDDIQTQPARVDGPVFQNNIQLGMVRTFFTSVPDLAPK